MSSEPESSKNPNQPASADFDFLKGPTAPKLKSTVAPSDAARRRALQPPLHPSAEPQSAAQKPESPQPKTMPSTPQNIDDFRRNAERQSREQKSFGNVLATLTYSILIAFILVTALAGYGAYILFDRLKLQGQSLVAINKRYDAEVIGLKEDLTRSHAEVQRLNDDVERQQEEVTRLRAIADKLSQDQANDHRDLSTLLHQLGRSASASASAAATH